MLSAKEVLRRGLENEPAVVAERSPVEVLRRALKLAAMNNHLARCPGASAANWIHCTSVACRDAAEAFGV